MKQIYTLFIFILFIFLVSCTKEKSCYDEELYKASQKYLCPADCPGVIGCDGKTYCNECMALKNGISIIK
jgi:hypothetical protein